MLKDIKLRTINKLIFAAMISSCLILGVNTLILKENIQLIDNTWTQYQADRSDKSRLESSLRNAIGYGGMIHEFKNFVLRHNPNSMEQIHRHIGAAISVINQYRLLRLSDAELIALDDIEGVIKNYEKFHFQINDLVASGHSITQIDKIVRVDDTPAIRGLKTLQRSVVNSRAPNASVSRARVSADLRGAIGYGGMIHNYKNYLLRHDKNYKKATKLNLQLAYQAIETYRSLNLSYAEELALNDIEKTLRNYAKNLDYISQSIDEGLSIKEIDEHARIDDYTTLRGLNTLDKAIHNQINDNDIAFSEAINFVKNTAHLMTWGLLIFLISIFIFGAWLVQARVMSPLLNLTTKMKKLSQNDFSITLEENKYDNELGDIARAMSIFRENMIERHNSKIELEKANNALNKQLKNILNLREQSEQQTSKALALAEGLAEARKSAEVSAQKAAENELRVSSILNSVQDSIITIDQKGVIEHVNPATERMFGYHSSELLKKNISMLMPDSLKEMHDEYLKSFSQHGSTRDASIPVQQHGLKKDGSTFNIEFNVSTITLSGETKIIGVIKDTTERALWEQEIKKLAMTDPLTELANRNQYGQRLDEAASIAMRNEQPFVLMLLDLDKFKPVNDRYGHPTGDWLLKHVAKILLECCRETDTVARLGGDEFAIILPPSPHPIDTNNLALRIIDKISQPVSIDGNTIQIGISIGISIFPDFANDVEKLHSQADEALYQAKENGRNTFFVYDNKNKK